MEIFYWTILRTLSQRKQWSFSSNWQAACTCIYMTLFRTIIQITSKKYTFRTASGGPMSIWILNSTELKGSSAAQITVYTSQNQTQRLKLDIMIQCMCIIHVYIIHVQCQGDHRHQTNKNYVHDLKFTCTFYGFLTETKFGGKGWGKQSKCTF